MLLIGVEAVRRLIQDQYLGIMDQCLRKAGPVTIAFRERIDALMENRLQKTMFDNLVGRLFLRCSIQASQFRTKGKKAKYRHIAVNRRIFREIPYPVFGG